MLTGDKGGTGPGHRPWEVSYPPVVCGGLCLQNWGLNPLPTPQGVLMTLEMTWGRSSCPGLARSQGAV